MRNWKKGLAWVLALVLAAGTVCPGFAAEPSILAERDIPALAQTAPEAYVSVIVELASAAVLEVEEFADAYAADSTGFSMSRTAALYRTQLAQQQAAVQQEIAQVAEGALFRYSYTNLINGFNAWVRYDDLDAIRAIDGVSNVYMTQQYDAGELWEDSDNAVELLSLDGEAADSGSMTQLGLEEAWANGFTGAGKVAAIFDSGLYSDNQVFQYYDLKALQEAYPELNLDTDVNGGTVRTAEGIRRILLANQSTMNIFQSQWNDWFHSWDEQYPVELPSGFRGDVEQQIEDLAFFTNDKIPFNVDYANGDFNTWTETADTETCPAYTTVSNHGTHVAGITAANAGPEKELGVKGSAYDAQIFFFKVFKEQDAVGQEGDEDVFAALDDAVTLGVNVFNLSLGIPNGFATNDNLSQAGYQRAYNSARNAGIAITVSAANDYREERTGALVNGYTAILPNNGSVGATAGLFSPFTVASAQGLGYGAYNSSNAPLTTAAFVNESGASVLKISNLKDNNGPLSVGEVVTEKTQLVWGGTAEEIEKAAEDAFAGKVAVVKMTQKGDLAGVTMALEKGALATVVINYSNSNSALTTIYLQAGLAFGAISTANGTTLETAMAKGPVYVTFTTNENDKAGTTAKTYKDYGPSSFTSWGVTEALRLKPDIMAPGGNILSAGVSHPNAMTYMSGTSMASPNLAGCMLLAQQYADTLIADGGLLDGQLKAGTLEYATLVDNLVGSTALPYMPYTSSTAAGPLMRDGEEGRMNGYFSPRRQGAGMAQMDKATATRVYLTSTMEVGYNLLTGESQRPKIELGEVGDSFTMAYQVVNMDTQAHTFQVDASMQTDATTLDTKGRYNIANYGNYGTDVDVIEEAVIAVAAVQNGTLKTKTANINRFAGSHAPSVVVVPAQSTAVVTLKVTLPDMAAYDAVFVNGMFLEGYVRMADTTANGVAVDLALPWLAFRGDWNDAPVFDLATVYDSITGKSTADLDYPIWYVDNLHTTNDGAEAVLGANQFAGRVLPDAAAENQMNNLRNYFSLMRTAGNLKAEWAAISPNGDGMADDVYAQFALLRNAKVLGVEILDEAGNVVKDLGYEFEYFQCLPADANLSHNIQTTAYDKYGHALNWDGTDANGKPVPDGQYYYRMRALLEADYLEMLNAPSVRTELNEFIRSLERSDSLVNGGELPAIREKVEQLVGEQVKTALAQSSHTSTMAVKVDTKAPLIQAEPGDGVWNVTVTDEVGVQAVTMYYDGVKVGSTTLVNAGEKTVSFDVSALGVLDETKVNIQAVDFAMNTASVNGGTVRGDVTGDGQITNADVIKLARSILGMTELTAEQKTAADVTGDGKITNADVIKLARVLIGLDMV